MLPAVLLYAGMDVLNGEKWQGLLKRASYLTLLANFAYPYLKCGPGVYWYFGITFQYYLLWAIFGKCFNGRNLLFWSIISIIGLYFCSQYGSHEAMAIYRHCITGWFPLFALGVWLGISGKGERIIPKHSAWFELLLFAVLFGIILWFSKRLVTWLFVPTVALAWFILIGLLLMRTKHLARFFRFVGKYSACIFVSHPIARSVWTNVFYPKVPYLFINVLIYIGITIVITFLYDKLYKWFLLKIKPAYT